MKVIFIPDYSSGNPYQHELAKALARYDVSVVMSDRISKFPILGAMMVHNKPNVLHVHWTLPFLLGNNRVKSIIKSIRFIAELVILKIIGIKIVWTVHNLLAHERQSKKLELFFHQLFARLCNLIIVHCVFARKTVLQTYHLPDYFKTKIFVIPHGNYINSYENIESRGQARSKLGLGNREFVFLYFGLIRPYKGVTQLVDAFLKLQSPQARLLLVGRPLNDAIKAELLYSCQSDSRIRAFLKYVPDKNVQIYMNAADVVVLPFQDILTSGSALLAMSFGKPIITPHIGCLSELLDSKGSFLYNPSEEEELLKAMQKALEARLAKMGLHNYAKAKHFTWNESAQKLYELYCTC